MCVYDEIFVFNVIKTCFLFCAGNFEYKMWLLVESNIVALLFNHFLDEKVHARARLELLSSKIMRTFVEILAITYHKFQWREN